MQRTEQSYQRGGATMSQRSDVKSYDIEGMTEREMA
jgi:hypothetical protein